MSTAESLFFFQAEDGIRDRDVTGVQTCALPISRCRYKAPVRYDDEVIVRTQLKNVRESVIHFGYELVRADDGELLAEGETTHIVTNGAMKAVQLPEKYLKVFRKATGR